MNTEIRKTFSKIGLSLAATTIIIEVIGTILVFLTKLYDPFLINSSWFNYVITAVSFYLIGLPLFYLMVSKIPSYKPEINKKLSIGNFLIIIVIAFSLLYIVNFITAMLIGIITVISGHNFMNPINDVISNSKWYITLLVAGIMAPIFEEIMFRGIIIDKLRKYGDTCAIVTSAILFGLFHGNLFQCFYAAALGLILGYLKVRTNSLRYSIILHMIINITGGILLPQILSTKNILTMYLVSAIVLSLIAAGIALFVLNYKKIKLENGTIKIQQGSVFKTCCLNIGMIFNLILAFALTIFSLLK